MIAFKKFEKITKEMGYNLKRSVLLDLSREAIETCNASATTQTPKFVSIDDVNVYKEELIDTDTIKSGDKIVLRDGSVILVDDRNGKHPPLVLTTYLSIWSKDGKWSPDTYPNCPFDIVKVIRNYDFIGDAPLGNPDGKATSEVAFPTKELMKCIRGMYNELFDLSLRGIYPSNYLDEAKNIIQHYDFMGDAAIREDVELSEGKPMGERPSKFDTSPTKQTAQDAWLRAAEAVKRIAIELGETDILNTRCIAYADAAIAAYESAKKPAITEVELLTLIADKIFEKTINRFVCKEVAKAILQLLKERGII